jgi:hypothetical protein
MISQAYVGDWLASFKDFPPRQKPASFSLDQVMDQLMSARSNQAERASLGSAPARVHVQGVKKMSYRRNAVWTAAGLLLVTANALAQPEAPAKEKGLVKSVASKLAISDGQAEAGTAAVLALAKNKLGDREFGVLSKALPEMDSILGKAGSLDITSLQGLTEHLKGLGIAGGVAEGFAPAVADYIEGQLGGAETKLLRSVLSKRGSTR